MMGAVVALVVAWGAPCAVGVGEAGAEHARGLGRRAIACGGVVLEAVRQRVPVHLAVRLAYHESRFDPRAVSCKGHRGVLQASARYWCPGGTYEGCDVTAAGVRALKYGLQRSGGRWEAAVAYFNAGRNPPPRALVYARGVAQEARAWR